MFHKTINVDNELLSKLENGTVKLRSGQWIKLEWCDRKARWIGRNPKSKTVWVSHYPWDNTQAMFDARSKSMREDFSS